MQHTFAVSFALIAIFNTGCILEQRAPTAPPPQRYDQPSHSNVTKQTVLTPQQHPTEVTNCHGHVCVRFFFNISMIAGNLSAKRLSELGEAISELLNKATFPDVQIDHFNFTIKLRVDGAGRYNHLHQQGFPPSWDKTLREALRDHTFPVDRSYTELQIWGSAQRFENSLP